MSLVKYTGVSKKYGSSLALDNINLEIPEGKIVGLLGPNGSGKTTLIKLTAGLLTPTVGDIEVAGCNIGPETKAMVSYLSDRNYLEKWMSVADCVKLFDDFYADFDKNRAEDMLQKLGVNKASKIRNLSKGTLEKMHLILVMSRRARLYLLDEPLGGVDPAARDYIMETILTNYSPESTILISTHLITDIEKILDDFVMIRDGQVIMQGACDSARSKYGMSMDEIFKEVFKC